MFLSQNDHMFLKDLKYSAKVILMTFIKFLHLLKTVLSQKQGIYFLEMTLFHSLMTVSFIWTVWLNSKLCSYAYSFLWHVWDELFPAAMSLWNCGQKWQARLTRFPLQIGDIRFCVKYTVNHTGKVSKLMEKIMRPPKKI